MLIPNPAGGFAFIPGIDPYSSGVIAADGFEIIHVTLQHPVPYRHGFELLDAHLRAAGRPRAALCAVELRSPAPFTRSGFVRFNAGYCELLREWSLLVDGANPVARTNVAPTHAVPVEEALFGFAYTVPAPDAGRTFVVAGAGELRGGPLLDAAVIRPGETSPAAMREKAGYVLKALQRRLEALGVGWAAVTTTDLYTAESLDSVSETVLEVIGPAALAGLRWYPSRPPIDELAFEMDCRGVRQERILPITPR